MKPGKWGISSTRIFRGGGYASEALHAVMRECFESGVHRIFAECDSRNISSWRLLEKVGMTREAFLQKKHILPQG